MPLGFLKQLLGRPSQNETSRAQWEPVIRAMVKQFRECRQEWFLLCIRLLKDEPGLRSNARLAGRAETATWVFQCVFALEFVGTQRYVAPENGQAFATQLFAVMVTDGRKDLLPEDFSLAQELYKLQVAARFRNDGSDIMELCKLVAEQILINPNYSAGMTISETMPIFANITSTVVAQAFGDSSAVRRLAEMQENC